MATAEAILSTKALARCGIGKTIEDLESDSSEEGSMCRLFFDDARRRLLESAAWPFATRRASLAQAASEARAGYGYVYGWPDECLAPQYIYPTDQAAYVPAGYPWPPSIGVYSGLTRADQRWPFEVEASLTSDARVICCDLAPTVSLAYTYDRKDLNGTSQKFRDALTYVLAVDLCEALVKKDGKLRIVLAQMERAVNEAWLECMAGRQQDPQVESESIRARS